MKFLDGYKTHVLGVFAIIVGLLKLVFEIPEVEAINVLGVDDAWTMITTGWGTIAGRSLATKITGETK